MTKQAQDLLAKVRPAAERISWDGLRKKGVQNQEIQLNRDNLRGPKFQV